MDSSSKAAVAVSNSFVDDILGGLVVAVGLGVSCAPPALFITLLVFFIASPISLYLDRVAATVVVFALIGAAIATQLVRNNGRLQSRAGRRISHAAFLFLAYMTLNAAWSISRGIPWNAALNELVPVYEMYGCFWLATHMKYDYKDAQRLLCFVLLIVAARGLWQVVYFFLGKADVLIPPIKTATDWGAEEISGYSFTRLFDPLPGVHVAIAFALFWTAARGAMRSITLLAMGVGTAVLILGLTRSEWIGTLLCIALVVVSGKKLTSGLRHVALAFGILLITGTVLSLFFQRMSLDLGEIMAARAFTYTQEQLSASDDSLQALRFLEVATATDAFKSSPVFGAGLGSDLQTQVSDGTASSFVVIHNYYLNLLANAGLTGALLLVFLVGTVWWTLRQIPRTPENSFQLACAVVASAGLVWYGILVCFQPIFSAYHIPSLLGIYLGIAVSSIPVVDSSLDRQLHAAVR
jgi:O-antigen ligase